MGGEQNGMQAQQGTQQQEQQLQAPQPTAARADGTNAGKCTVFAAISGKDAEICTVFTPPTGTNLSIRAASGRTREVCSEPQ